MEIFIFTILPEEMSFWQQIENQKKNTKAFVLTNTELFACTQWTYFLKLISRPNLVGNHFEKAILSTQILITFQQQQQQPQTVIRI